MRTETISGIQGHDATVMKLGRYVLLVALAIVFIFPILFMVVSSFKPDTQIFQDVTSMRAYLPVGDVSLDNYGGMFDRVPVGRFIFNSLFVTITQVGLGLLVNSMAGFALSRIRFRGQKMLLTLIIATLIIPGEAVAIPMLQIVAQLPWIGFDGLRVVFESGWLDTYRVQIVPGIVNAFSIYLFYSFFLSIPRELDEAARVDGASWFQIYRRVILPISGPVFATVTILTALPAWNAYLWPLMTTTSESIRPVQVGLQYFFQLDTDWGEVMAYTTIITLPVLGLFLMFQRAFVNSLASSGLKG